MKEKFSAMTPLLMLCRTTLSVKLKVISKQRCQQLNTTWESEHALPSFLTLEMSFSGLPDMHTMVTGCSRVFLFLRTLILQEYDVAGVVAADITIHIWNHAETVVAAK